MLRKWKLSVRSQFVIVAVSLFLITTILGMSASLHDVVEYRPSFYVIGSGDVNINFTETAPINRLVERGKVIECAPTIINEGQIDAYLFIELDMDMRNFLIMSIDNRLHRFEDNFYYYGISKDLSSFSPGDQCTIFNSIEITADERTSCDFAIKAYAIQTLGYENSTSQDVWKDIHDTY